MENELIMALAEIIQAALFVMGGILLLSLISWINKKNKNKNK